MTAEKIIIVEDDEGARFLLQDSLADRYQIQVISSLRDFEAFVSDIPEDTSLALIDLTLNNRSVVPILMEHPGIQQLNFIVVSATDDQEILKACLEAGASDYLTKPFNSNELRVKVERALKGKKKTLGRLFDERRLVAIGPLGESSPLTSKEYQIYKALCRRFGEPTPRSQIMEKVWGKTQVGHKTLDVHLHKLRRKIETIGLAVRFLAPDSYILTFGSQ